MSQPVIKLENVSKMYRLGEISTGSLAHDLQRSWAKLRGKPDPFAKVGVTNDRTIKGDEYVWALRDIDLQVEEGEVLGIIGGNGAGKSTLLKLLSRVTAPTKGKILTRGRIASLLEVGTGFHQELTGRENIYLNGAILGMAQKEITKRLEEIVEFSGCVKYIDTPVKRYSTGMQVRLAFAVAAHLDCEILIVDEVLAVGDIEFQQKSLGWMQEVSNKQQKTILFVSHNLDAVHRICSTGVNIKNGIIDYKGNIDRTIEHYLTNKKIGDRHIFDTNQRLGDGQVKIRDFVIKNNQNKVQSLLTPGMNYVCEITYEVVNKLSLPLGNVVAGIEFIDNRGVTTLLLNSATSNNIFKITELKGILKCEFNDLNLAPSDYSITLFLGQTNNHTFDCLSNLINITVSGGDYFGSKHPGFPDHCKTLKRANWEILLP